MNRMACDSGEVKG